MKKKIKKAECTALSCVASSYAISVVPPPPPPPPNNNHSRTKWGKGGILWLIKRYQR